MANAILEDSLPVIKLSLSEYDEIIECITKANAAMEIFLAMPLSTLEDVSSEKFYYFVWSINDSSSKAYELLKDLRVSNTFTNSTKVNSYISTNNSI